MRTGPSYLGNDLELQVYHQNGAKIGAPVVVKSAYWDPIMSILWIRTNDGCFTLNPDAGYFTIPDGNYFLKAAYTLTPTTLKPNKIIIKEYLNYADHTRKYEFIEKKLCSINLALILDNLAVARERSIPAKPLLKQDMEWRSHFDQRTKLPRKLTVMQALTRRLNEPAFLRSLKDFGKRLLVGTLLGVGMYVAYETLAKEIYYLSKNNYKDYIQTVIEEAVRTWEADQIEPTSIYADIKSHEKFVHYDETYANAHGQAFLYKNHPIANLLAVAPTQTAPFLDYQSEKAGFDFLAPYLVIA